MSPTNPHISNQLRQLIYYHLDNNLIRNALFLAGRLHAYEPRSSEAAYLVALCYLQNGQIKSAYDYSRIPGSRGTHLGCSYVFAQACLELGKYIEGIAALDRSKGLWTAKNNWNKHSESKRQYLPDAAAVFCLQGKLWHAHKDITKAVASFVEALKLNPFMWDAFLALCECGANVQVPNLYKMTPEMIDVLAATSASDISSGTVPEKALSINGPSRSQQTNSSNTYHTSVDPFVSSNPRSDVENAYGSQALWEKLNGSAVSVASAGGGVGLEGIDPLIVQEEPDDIMRAPSIAPINIAEAPWDAPPAPARKPRPAQGLGMDFSSDAPPKMRTASIKSKSSRESDELSASRVPIPPPAPTKRTISGQVAQSMSMHNNDLAAPQRRSVRLFNQIRPATSKLASTANTLGLRDGRELKKAKAPGTKGKTGTASTVGRVVSGNRNHINAMEIDSKELRGAPLSQSSSGTQRSAAADKSKEYEALQFIFDLFAKLGSGYFALTRYRCREAIAAFESLPPSQRDTPWVMAQIGRALYEQASYVEAEKIFTRIKIIAPSRLEDAEVYSTVLWHLKNDVELAFLAHELMEIDRLSPQSWCAIGNAFSLQGDHDQALKCFTRATQLNPKFAYAFTLQGHEHVANEEYDKALDAYRSGIHAETRHYNAWYGLGKVYEKMGKYEMAVDHFRTAANINPENAVLVCCVGMVLEKMKEPKRALLQYTRACDLAPQSALSRFKKARVLMALGEPHLALVELKILKDIAPDEANVHFLLGKLYKSLHDKANAIKHFTTALNLDPKAAQYIKDAMETLDEETEDDDGEMS